MSVNHWLIIRQWASMRRLSWTGAWPLTNRNSRTTWLSLAGWSCSTIDYQCESVTGALFAIGINPDHFVAHGFEARVASDLIADVITEPIIRRVPTYGAGP